MYILFSFLKNQNMTCHYILKFCVIFSTILLVYFASFQTHLRVNNTNIENINTSSIIHENVG